MGDEESTFEEVRFELAFEDGKYLNLKRGDASTSQLVRLV